MNTKIVIGIVILLLLALGLWWWQSGNLVSLQGPATQGPNDTTGTIQQDLNSLDLGDLDAEFQEIDSNINQL
ncbi:MAG: hypothetical protein HYS60_00855 [Candidatus Wildermuthbacteria bacterium]|nr:hypothetical protein [Candidatus Wildermuthbacteria bacterium]